MIYLKTQQNLKKIQISIKNKKNPIKRRLIYHIQRNFHIKKEYKVNLIKNILRILLIIRKVKIIYRMLKNILKMGYIKQSNGLKILKEKLRILVIESILKRKMPQINYLIGLSKWLKMLKIQPKLNGKILKMLLMNHSQIYINHKLIRNSEILRYNRKI